MPTGFLPFRQATFMLDVVTLAMVLVLPIMTWSIFQVRQRGKYALHRLVQLTLGSVLLVAVLLFEIDIRVNGWDHLIRESPYYGSTLFQWVLGIHLCFSITTTLAWIATIVGALRNFSNPPTPAPYSSSHARWGWLSAIGMYCTAVTGWIFYWMAFIAE